ncbi:MAG: hypothetical protein ABJ308_13845 [Halieaceae bacterium]
MIVTLTGCALLNPALDEKAFRNLADGYIGKESSSAILDSELRKPKESTTIDETHVEYVLSHKYLSQNSGKTYGCLWAITVDTSTDKIVSWRYISDASDCKAQYFYGGAW